MKLKDLMIESLTELLEDGETLMHPVYGVLQQSNTQYYGFFGFTEEHLLIVLISATKKIIFTSRVPLDIKSVNIKQNRISREYTVDISFNDAAPCKILISPKVLTIDSQKENLPHFLAYLREKAPKQSKTNLKEIDGTKVRWQLFTVFIYFMLSFFPMILIIITVIPLKSDSFSWSFMAESVPVFLSLLSPFFVLAIINRLFMGKILCVLNHKGLHLENDFIPWKDVKRIEYHPELPSKYKVTYTYASFIVSDSAGNEYAIDIAHFPIYGLRAAKKFAPHIKLETSTSKKLYIVFFFLLPSLLGLIISLFR